MPDEAVLSLLKSSAFGGPALASVETLTTHISVVLLGGDRVLKLKRPVKLGYVDFTDPGQCLAICESEVDLNRRTAPQLYRGVHRITRDAGGTLRLDGAGDIVEAAVSMRRFEEASLLDLQAEAGTL